MATATGDLLFSRAFAELARNRRRDEVRALSAASTALARGELLQRADAFSPDVDEERYFERCRLKTGALFEAACRLGAILGEPGTASAEALGAFGDRIGLAFQLFDDVLDVSGPPDQTGKGRGTDLLDGTVTLPLILARRADPSLNGARPANTTEAFTSPGRRASAATAWAGPSCSTGPGSKPSGRTGSSRTAGGPRSRSGATTSSWR